MNKNVAEIIDALAAHQDHSSIEVFGSRHNTSFVY